MTIKTETKVDISTKVAVESSGILVKLVPNKTDAEENIFEHTVDFGAENSVKDDAENRIAASIAGAVEDAIDAIKDVIKNTEYKADSDADIEGDGKKVTEKDGDTIAIVDNVESQDAVTDEVTLIETVAKSLGESIFEDVMNVSCTLDDVSTDDVSDESEEDSSQTHHKKRSTTGKSQRKNDIKLLYSILIIYTYPM